MLQNISMWLIDIHSSLHGIQMSSMKDAKFSEK